MARWQTILERPGYSVNDQGDVINNFTEKQLKPTRYSNGYLFVTLCDETGHHKESIHRLVAKTFIDNPGGYKYVNHIDGDKTNNKVENLEWCTQSENMKHAYRTGLQKPISSQIKYSLSRAAEAKKRSVRNIETGVSYASVTECAQAEGLTHSAVSRHVNGRNKKCRFEYVG